jgi:hypothetical protein
MSSIDTERAAPQAAPVPDSPGGFGGPRLSSPTYPRLRAS